MKKPYLTLIALLLFLVAVALMVRLAVTDTPPAENSTESSTTAPSDTAVIVTDPTPPPVTDPTGPHMAASQIDAQVTAATAFVFDVESLEVLYLKGGLNDQLYPASITKLFTAWVALQYMDENAVVTCGEEVRFVAEDSSRAYLAPGHRLTVSMLIEAMMLPSGNDAAYALAAAAGREISKNSELTPQQAVDAFVAAMNESAAQLGLTGSHFESPDGYHSDGHYTTARDLMQISRLALENPIISRYAAVPKDTVTFESGEETTWVNTNYLLDPNHKFYCQQAIGLKTGRTKAAGWCLLSAFQTENRKLVIGIFGCEESDDRFTDTLNLFAAATE